MGVAMRSWQALWALSAVACGVVAYPKGDLGPADSAVGETDPPVEDTPLDSPSDTPADTPLDSPSDTPLDTPPDTDPPQETGSGTGSGGGPAPRDDDGDGAPASGDCDDGDADVFPGATELCNAVDDDCDGGVDEGLISDGAGCLDAGPPTFPATASILHVITHTGTSTYDDSDTVQISLCLDATRCWSLGNPNWNDWELGNADVKVVEGINLARSAVNRVQLRLDGGGSDAWDPDCVQVVLDGEVIHASDPGVVFGDGAGEVSSWTSPGGPTVSRTTCHPSRLTHGPYPGAVGAYDARLWFRTDATRRTELRVVPLGASLSTAPVVAVRYPAAAQDFAEVVSVYGLQPNTAYAYRVTADGAAAEDGVFRTAPTGASQFRFAFGSCAKEDAQPIFGMIAGLDPDVFLFVGDNHYGNTNDLSDLRQFYRWAHERPERRAMMRNRANVAVWDDHDYVGNNTTGSSSGKDRALRAFGEYWANPSYGLATTPGIFSTWDWGDVRFFLLDDRYWRGLDDNILGNAQTTWLKDQLRASNATFNVLVDGSVWTPEKTGDGWGDYPAAVDDLLAFVRDEGIEGVVFLSGDVHRSELRRVAGAPGGYTVPELISSPLANSNSACEDANSHVTCGDSDDYVIAVDVDTTLADPCMTATLYGSAGNVVKTWTFCASSLRNPSPPSRAPRPDYDADGYADLVIGVPDEDVGSVVDAGAVQVFYGGTDGASPLDETLFDQDSTGFLGDPETSDRLGKVVASGDFDADGFDDLALGVPDENIGSDTNSGFVEVLYGGPSGLSTAGMQQFFQGTAGLGGATEVDDAFGAALAVGDFDGDGYDDLAVGVPGEDGAGLVEVLFGGPGGLAVSGYQTFDQENTGGVSTSESGDDFGAALAAGDYDGDGFADLAIGHPGEDIDGVADVGMFTVVFGAPSGLLNTRDQTFHQDSAGVPGSPESGDGMASVLAAGDSDGDARDELAVGLAGEAIGSVSDAGYVIVFRGAVGGLSTTGLFAVEGSDLGWSLGTGDALGAALAWGDVNADGWADLALGAPGRSVGGEDGAGTVALLWGGPSGLSTSGWLSFEQEPVPFIGSEAGDGHGSAVRLLDTDGDGDDEVVCGAPDEDLSGGSDAGMVTVFGVRSLSTADAQRWYQDMPDVGGDAEAGDGFGAAL